MMDENSVRFHPEQAKASRGLRQLEHRIKAKRQQYNWIQPSSSAHIENQFMASKDKQILVYIFRFKILGHFRFFIPQIRLCIDVWLNFKCILYICLNGANYTFFDAGFALGNDLYLLLLFLPFSLLAAWGCGF
ncbi:unnamed protein product [Protopolystoma xenopodis]|uniref:Uncharacterized protein n=1 Tax=Protopolystoma xenopodis TaxID=117903 RepID=A0A3S5B4R8_9PLAT|nr:unnamed protein product [Protopolystoma xenopodis]